MDKIKELRELLAKATPGPWSCDDSDLSAREIAVIGRMEIYSKSSPFCRQKAEDDAALIVAAINALPALLAVAEALPKIDRLLSMNEDRDSRDACKIISAALTKLDEVKS